MNNLALNIRGGRRVVAIDFAARGFGFAVIETSGQLIDYGLKETRGNKRQFCIEQILDILRRYRPDAVIMEDFAHSRRTAENKDLIADAVQRARDEKYDVQFLHSEEVRSAFDCQPITNRDGVAEAVAAIYPELNYRLPTQRRFRDSEDSRIRIFGAVGLALAFIRGNLK